MAPDSAMRDVVRVDEESPRAVRRFRVRRSEKQAEMAAQSWPEFWRDLVVRFVVAGAVVLVVFAVIWLVRL